MGGTIGIARHAGRHWGPGGRSLGAAAEMSGWVLTFQEAVVGVGSVSHPMGIGVSHPVGWEGAHEGQAPVGWKDGCVVAVVHSISCGGWMIGLRRNFLCMCVRMFVYLCESNSIYHQATTTATNLNHASPTTIPP